VLRRIFGRKREEVVRSWRKLDMFTSPSSDIIMVIISRRMKQASNVARMGEMKNTKFWSETPKRRGQSEDIDVDVMIILEWMSEK